MKYLAFKQDGNNFSRYTSTYQAGVEDGSLMRYYRENFENLKCFGPDVPEFLYSTFKNWGFVLVLRTTPTIHSLNYMMDFPDGNISLPVVRASDYKLEFHFHESLPRDNLQNMYIVSVRPSTIKIGEDRKIKMSYRSN